MRFAGSAPITDFLSKGIDTGGMAQASAARRSDMKNAITGLEADMGANALGAIGAVESAGLIADGQAAQARGQAQGSMFSSLGSALGGAIGSFGSIGGGVTSYNDIPPEGLRGAAAGGGPNAYYGTGGRYGSFQPGPFMRY